MTMQQDRLNDTCIVIGNGPSLKGFDFHRLNGFATLGMNAAYRHWDRIGWYPTFYSCLDDQLIKTHHAEIERLFADGMVEKVFVHDSFFEYHPHRQGHPDFTAFHQTSQYWYTQIAEAKRLPRLYDSPAFKMSNASKITTGAHALRYVANMGYARIALLGIDLRYVEILPEAEMTDGIGLIIKTTPRTNPNYFFDGYQKAGDLFNIPNPAVHDGKLHEASFEMIPRDFEENSVNCRVINCNRQSILSDKDIFPYVPVNELLNESQLGCVFVPTNSREIDAILGNFKLWAMPEFAPAIDGVNCDRPALVFIFNNGSAKTYQNRIRDAYDEFGMGRYFSSLNFEYLNLEGEADSYIRDYTQPVGDMGFKAGPNNQFFQSLRRAASYGRYGFLMETDCLAIRRGWLTRLQKLVDGSEPFWVMGSPYRGLHKLSKDFVRHLNGNSVYAVGDADFQSFVTEFWEHHTWRLVRTKDKRLAYDCILEIMFSETDIQEDSVMNVWKRVAQKFRYTDFIQNISGSMDIAETDEHLMGRIRVNSPETYIIHNRAAHMIELQKYAEVTPKIASPFPENISYPRLLVFDMTAMGNGTATGELKLTLLADWPADRLLQIAKQGPHGLASVKRGEQDYPVTPLDAAGARNAIADFAPDIILYRPVPNTTELHSLAMDEIRSRNLPLVTWIMDDWPAQMEAEDPTAWNKMKPDLAELVAESALRLSISNAMSEAFARRYGKPFVPLANGVDPADWHMQEKLSSGDGVFRLRFAGGLAPDMNRKSIQRIAEAVERIGDSGTKISFQIMTQPWWMEQTKELFAKFKHTSIKVANLSPSDYRKWISESDGVAIAYNFDAESQRYIQYSMANKLPECLASGAVVLAFGPSGVATIDYLDGLDCAVVVTENSDKAVEDALREMLTNPARRSELTERARTIAFSRHNVLKLREALRESVVRAAATRSVAPPPLVAVPNISAGGELDSAASLLRFASQLLLAPNETLNRIEADATVSEIIDSALKSAATNDRVRAHFNRCLAHAQKTQKVLQ